MKFRMVGMRRNWGTSQGIRGLKMFFFLNWVVECRLVMGVVTGVPGTVLSDSLTLREDLGKLGAVFPRSSILNANNADSEFLEKVNIFSIFCLRSKRDKMLLSRKKEEKRN